MWTGFWPDLSGYPFFCRVVDDRGNLVASDIDLVEVFFWDAEACYGYPG